MTYKLPIAQKEHENGAVQMVFQEEEFLNAPLEHRYLLLGACGERAIPPITGSDPGPGTPSLLQGSSLPPQPQSPLADRH